LEKKERGEKEKTGETGRNQKEPATGRKKTRKKAGGEGQYYRGKTTERIRDKEHTPPIPISSKRHTGQGTIQPFEGFVCSNKTNGKGKLTGEKTGSTAMIRHAAM